MPLRLLTVLLIIFSLPVSAKKTKPKVVPKKISFKQKILHAKRVQNLYRHMDKKSKKTKVKAMPPPLVFDLPITYNERVKFWIHYFQTRGKRWFQKWLNRSNRFLPMMQKKLTKAGLPEDLAYIPMIESGYSTAATSHAQAVGPWQFISATGKRFGLRTYWWIDERRDPEKSTDAAIRYLSRLYKEFRSWYLVAAGYNMGESGVRRRIKKYGTRDYWELVELKAFPRETRNYVPKLMAALLISKAPGLYGFRKMEPEKPLLYDTIHAPGGTDLIGLADQLGVTRQYLKKLNPALTRGFVPKKVRRHKIRIPKGSKTIARAYLTRRHVTKKR